MVKLTASSIEKKCLQQQSFKSLTREIDRIHLKKITHLFMDERNIDEIDNISSYKNLKVIYLQRNSIKKIENLDFAVNLTHLYLQHNNISKIENLGNLTNLRKLYLGYNNIKVVEGLEKLSNLLELHVEKQTLASGEKLSFDPRTAKTLAGCLTHLNISDNNMQSLSSINFFTKLITLEAKDNAIDSIEDLTKTVNSLKQLENLYLQGNPVTKNYRYRENVIANSYSLVVLDEKYISENTREFLQKLKIEKLQQSRRKIEIPISEDLTSSLKLPPAFQRSVSRAISQNINPKFSFSGISLAGESQPYVFPPWKTTTSLKAIKDNHVLPRLLWKNKRVECIIPDPDPRLFSLDI